MGTFGWLIEPPVVEFYFKPFWTVFQRDPTAFFGRKRGKKRRISQWVLWTVNGCGFLKRFCLEPFLKGTPSIIGFGLNLYTVLCQWGPRFWRSKVVQSVPGVNPNQSDEEREISSDSPELKNAQSLMVLISAGYYSLIYIQLLLK